MSINTQRDAVRRRTWLLCGAVLLAAMLLQLAVNLHITVYSDDYWYGTFFDEGLRGFLDNTRQHYLNTNGRVFVHILIPILLLADTRVFAFLSPILTALILLLGLHTQDRRIRGPVLLLAGGLGLLSVLGSEIQYLRMTLYWLAAYFNYVFPILLPLLVLWGADRLRAGRISLPGFLFFCLMALLAGASTEQCGVISLILIVGDWLLHRFREPSRDRSWLFPLLTCLGYLTILTAPGSHARMERGIDGGILSVLRPEVFTARYFDVMNYLCRFGFWNCLFIAFCLLTALLRVTDRKDVPAHLLSGFPAALVTLLLWQTGRSRGLAVFTVVYAIYVAVTLLFTRDYQRSALFLMGGGASVLMLIVTTLYYARTFFPCVLLFLLVSWSFLLRVLRDRPKGVALAVFAVLSCIFLVRYVPIYRGYAANDRVVEQNLAAIEESRTTGELTLNIDMDADYRFTSFFEGNYFLDNFLRYYHVSPDTRVRFTSDVWDLSDVEVSGQRSRFPALEKDGQLLIPIEFPFLAAGEQCQYHWTDHTYDIVHGGRSYRLYESGQLTELVDGREIPVAEDCRTVIPFSYTFTLLYLPAEDFDRCFGMTFRYDPSADVYILEE